MLIAPKEVSFRELVPKIPSTTYVTHGIHYYPARFIPQVVRFAIRSYSEEGDWVLDPFAGSGTVAVEALITGRNATLVDINPITKWLTSAKTRPLPEDAVIEFLSMVGEVFDHREPVFRPRWKNLLYWHPAQVIDFLERMWGYIHFRADGELKPFLVFGALKVTRALSYADDQVPKLYRSKRKEGKLRGLLSGNWERWARRLFTDTTREYIASAIELGRMVRSPRSRIEVFAPVDATQWEPNREFDLLLTSPPYLQAHEYIRSSKIDLYWLGYSDAEIRRLTRLEIPYKEAPEIVRTPTLDEIRTQLKGRPDLIEMLDSYFYHTMASLLRISERVRGRVAIFVGTPKVSGIDVPIWQIFVEYFEENGLKLEELHEDKIKVRKLFPNRKNLNPSGMPSEFLMVFSRRG